MTEDRRAFLAKAGRFALATGPMTTLLLSTSLNSKAIAQSGVGESSTSSSSSSEDFFGGGQQSFGGPGGAEHGELSEVFGSAESAGGANSSGGAGGGGGDSCAYDRKHHHERPDCPPEKLVRPAHWGNNTTGSKVFKF